MKNTRRTTGRFLTYQVVISPDEDGSAYNVRVPALPGCFTFGDSLEEALAMAREAIELTVESMLVDDQSEPRETRRPIALGVNELLTNVTVEIPQHVSKAASSDRPRAHA